MASKVACKFHPDAPLIEDYGAGDLLCSECREVVNLEDILAKMQTAQDHTSTRIKGKGQDWQDEARRMFQERKEVTSQIGEKDKEIGVMDKGLRKVEEKLGGLAERREDAIKMREAAAAVEKECDEKLAELDIEHIEMNGRKGELVEGKKELVDRKKELDRKLEEHLGPKQSEVRECYRQINWEYFQVREPSPSPSPPNSQE